MNRVQRCETPPVYSILPSRWECRFPNSTGKNLSDGLEVHAKEKPSRRVAAEQRRPLDEQVRATLR